MLLWFVISNVFETSDIDIQAHLDNDDATEKLITFVRAINALQGLGFFFGCFKKACCFVLVWDFGLGALKDGTVYFVFTQPINVLIL